MSERQHNGSEFSLKRFPEMYDHNYHTSAEVVFSGL